MEQQARPAVRRDDDAADHDDHDPVAQAYLRQSTASSAQDVVSLIVVDRICDQLAGDLAVIRRNRGYYPTRRLRGSGAISSGPSVLRSNAMLRCELHNKWRAPGTLAITQKLNRSRVRDEVAPIVRQVLQRTEADGRSATRRCCSPRVLRWRRSRLRFAEPRFHQKASGRDRAAPCLAPAGGPGRDWRARRRRAGRHVARLISACAFRRGQSALRTRSRHIRLVQSAGRRSRR